MVVMFGSGLSWQVKCLVTAPCHLWIAVLTCKIEELGSELKEHHKIEAFTPLHVPAQVRVLGSGLDNSHYP